MRQQFAGQRKYFRGVFLTMDQPYPPDALRHRLWQAAKTMLLLALTPRRAVIRWCAIGISCSAALLILVALIWPGYWHLGSITISLHSTRTLSYVIEAALFAWLTTWKQTPDLLRAIRKNWSWPRQFVLVLLSVNAIVAIHTVLTYPQYLVDNYRAVRLAL